MKEAFLEIASETTALVKSIVKRIDNNASEEGLLEEVVDCAGGGGHSSNKPVLSHEFSANSLG